MSGYTFPEENATILDRRKRSAAMPGWKTFIAQVRCSEPVDPNFRPVMKMTFSASGSGRQRIGIEQIRLRPSRRR